MLLILITTSNVNLQKVVLIVVLYFCDYGTGVLGSLLLNQKLQTALKASADVQMHLPSKRTVTLLYFLFFSLQLKLLM